MSLRVLFVVDSGTDVRLVDELAMRTELRVLARTIPGGRVVSQQTRHEPEIEVGPSSHAAFASFTARRILALRQQTDVVVVQGYGPTAAVANVAARLAGVRASMLVCSPVEAYYRCRSLTHSTRRFSAVEYAVIRAFRWINARIGRHYIALSPYLESVIAESGTRAPIDVIPVYGVDTDLFRPTGESKPSVRARLGLPDGTPIVFFSSRVAPEKDAATVLDAVRLFVDGGRDIRLLHLSGGHAEFAALAAERGLGSHVICGDAVPPFEALADHYRASDVCVQASREEGLGFSPLEALACGIPVVASAVGGLNDTIRDGETGWQVPVGDPRAMAAAIAAVLDDPHEAARRTARGGEMVRRTYDTRLVFDGLMACLDPKQTRAARRHTLGYAVPPGVQGGMGHHADQALRAAAAALRNVTAFGPRPAVVPQGVTVVAPPAPAATWRYSWRRYLQGAAQLDADRRTGQWLAARLGNGCGSAYLFTQIALESLQALAPRGTPHVLDNPNGHIRDYRDAVQREADRWLTGPYPQHPTGAMADRVEAEYRLARRIRVASSWALESMVARGVERERITCVPHTVDLERFVPRPAARLDDGVLRIVFVGQIGLAKGFQYLLEALRRLDTQRIATRFVGATGDPWCRRLFERLATGLTIEAQPGDPREAYQRADLLVLPTLHDGFGFVVAEAMASGLPVITTDQCGAAEWIRPGETGWIVPAGHTDALASAIDAAAQTRARLRDMGMAARRDIEALAGAGGTLRAFIAAEMLKQAGAEASHARGAETLLAEATARS
jgi:glycosyltransferase involved in cell wall biosynthesis